MRLLTHRRRRNWAILSSRRPWWLVVVAAFVGHTLLGNLARLNLAGGFDFLGRPAGMQIAETMLPVEPADSFAWMILVAALNTVRVAGCAVVLATLLGTAVGTMRLSANPLLRAITSTYVELFRNTPLLLQIVFWAAILLRLPSVRNAIDLGGFAYLSQRGLQLPAPVVLGGSMWLAAGAGSLAGLLALGVVRWRGSRRGRGAFCAWFVAAAVTALVLEGRIGLERPVRKLLGYQRRDDVDAGVLRPAARAGRLHRRVHRRDRARRDPGRAAGQWEAARSLGLRDGTILRRIVLPQALRIILPPLTNQYVAIIKNSSLAIAIGYPDLFWAISTAINVTGHAIEGVVVLMFGYLALTLGTAGVMNGWYRRMLRRGAA